MKICFWGNVTGALMGTAGGGGELQIALLAKALVRGGNEAVIIDLRTAEDFTTADGIKVLRIKGWNNGIRIIRTLTHRLPLLYRSLINQQADVYYCRMRDFRHIIAFWAARKVKAKFILQMASDLDAMSFMMRMKNHKVANLSGLWGTINGILVEIVYAWLLRKADLVLVQHEGQKNILLKRNIKSIVFPNLIDLTEIPVLSNQRHKDFIYVGWLDKRKGIAEFFKLVEKAPSHTFKIVGPPRDKTGYFYSEKLRSFSNVALLGELTHSETVYQIADAKALISTSPMEGFPNVFIEAWACGIPVLSLYVDPGSVIEKEGLGDVAHRNMNNLLFAMDKIKTTSKFAERAKTYVEHNHSLNAEKINLINNLFSE